MLPVLFPSLRKRYNEKEIIVLFNNDLFLKQPYNRFKEFISAQADRYSLLLSVLDECSLPAQTLEIERKRHIVVSGSENSQNPQSTKAGLILTAHYDRAPQSPGANDNGAAVFQLIDTALRMHAQQKASRTAAGANAAGTVLFIFTDGEELSKGENLRSQGSYSLGQHLKKTGLGNSPIFTFDACGTGDTLIISTAADLLLKNESGAGAETSRRKAQTLRRIALEAARKVRLEKALLLPTPFSEDAGFLLSGMTAQTITVLPHDEAAIVRSGGTSLSKTDRRLIPETWRVLNGPGDSPLRLTPLNWKIIPAFAGALAEQISH